ncbi:LacI family DNA-binding transcriptional regulator [Kitasatospora sp. NPDC048365]|uniref:LacI family DNA-binding transcriptional regulator n=1 Tax=Kitasatospora sp. NPDC048365 TaxID=3364050 RepID=UPI00371D8BEE
MTDTPRPRIRLVDVAREAGLSKTTVSAALNGTGRLSPAVRERAREAARALGYRPNATARLLRAGHARLIGFAVGEYPAGAGSYMESPYFAQLTSATATAALEHGYALVLLPSGATPDEWNDLPLDAAIVADPLIDDPLVEDFLQARIPLFTDRSVEGREGAHWVDIDTVEAVRGVLDHLREQGARRTAFVSQDARTRFHRESGEAYRSWCEEQGVEERSVLAERPGNGAVIAAVEQALRGGADALFVVAEVAPPLVLDAARRHGLAVPRDLLVVCAGEDGTAEHADPPVSTLGLRPTQVAEAGVELLVAALESGDPAPTGRLVRTELTVRASSLR